MSSETPPQPPPIDDDQGMSAEVLDAEASSPAPPPPPPIAVVEENKRDIFHQAARASWRAPIVAILIGMVSFTLRDQSRLAAMIIGGANALIILLGLIFAIVALCGLRGRRGIIAPATIGLVLNLLLVVMMAAALSGAMGYHNMRGPVGLRTGDGTVIPLETPRASDLPAVPAVPGMPGVPAVPPPNTAQASQELQRALDAVEKYPGWVGVSTRAGRFTLVIVQSNDQAPGTQDVKAHFATPCTLVWVCANNTTSGTPHVVDARSLEFHLADYSAVGPIPAATITAAAKRANDPLLARGDRPIPIAGYTQMPDCPVFFPENTDFTHATAATLIVDGQRIVIPGKYLSLEEKQDNLRKSQQQQSKPK